MSFLGRARRFLQELGTEGPQVQTFNLACASGHRVRGERTEGYQALRCPSCGEGVFVLPRSPLPEPVPPAGASPPRSYPGRNPGRWDDDAPIELTDLPPSAVATEDVPGGDGPGIEWDEAPAEASPRRAARDAPEDLAAAEIEAARRRESAPTPSAVQPARRRPTNVPPPAPTHVEPRPRPRARTGPRPALILVLVALVIAASVGFRSWRNFRAQYPFIAERGRSEGIPALERGDFDLAYQLLSAARSAVNALGGAVEGAAEIQQAASEAAVFNDLCPEPLEELLEQAGRASARGDWETNLEKLYRGRYFLFDTTVVATPADGGRYEIAYTVFPAGEASRFGDGNLPLPDRYARIDLTGFRLFELAEPAKGARIAFGAKLRSIDYESEAKQWVVRIEPEGGAFITHTEALRAIGWPSPQMVELPKEDQP